MLYPLFTQEFIHHVVLELGAIVSSNCLDLTIMLMLSFFGKVDEGFLSFIFSLEKEHPSISCEVINNEKAIPPPSQTIICWGPKNKQPQKNQAVQSKPRQKFRYICWGKNIQHMDTEKRRSTLKFTKAKSFFTPNAFVHNIISNSATPIDTQITKNILTTKSLRNCSNHYQT